MANVAARQAVIHPVGLSGGLMTTEKRKQYPEEHLDSRKRYKNEGAGKSIAATVARHNEPKEHERPGGILPDIFPSTKVWDRGDNPMRSQLLRDKLREERKLKENKTSAQNTEHPSHTSRDEERRVAAETMKPPRARTGPASAGKVDVLIDPPSASLETTIDTMNRSGAEPEKPVVDMAAALKGMAYARLATPVRHQAKPGTTAADISQQKAPTSQTTAVYPQDWSLKTSAHFLSSESFEWCRLTSSLEDYEGLHHFVHASERGNCISDTKPSGSGRVTSESIGNGATFKQALHSWVYPQIQLPKAVLNAVSTSASQGGAAEADFLKDRQRGWEESFRSVYYAYRNKKCDSFYYCTTQFVVFFCNGTILGRPTTGCCAYVTRSTRGLRELLLKEEVAFRMPLVFEDGVGLELDQRSGPWYEASSIPDNGPMSLLFVEGGRHLNGLFDLLLNYRHYRSLHVDGDLPMLMAPVPFQNACLQATAFNSKRMKRVEVAADQGAVGQLTGMEEVYSLEFKGIFLPFWTISKLCNLFKVSQHGHFEASFTTAPLTEFLNMPLASHNNAFGSEESSHSTRRYDVGPSVVSRLRCQKNLYHVNFSKRVVGEARAR